MNAKIRQRFSFIFVDYAASVCAMILYFIVRHAVVPELSIIPLADYLERSDVVAPIFVFPIAMIGIFALSGFYNEVLIVSRLSVLINTFWTTWIGAGIFLVFFLSRDVDTILAMRIVKLICCLWGLMFILVWIGRAIICAISNKWLRTGKVNFPTLIVGLGTEGKNMLTYVHEQAPDRGIKIIGFVNLPDEVADERLASSLPVYQIEDLRTLKERHANLRLILAPSKKWKGSIERIVEEVFPLGVPIFISARDKSVAMRLRVGDIVGEPLVEISRPSMTAATANMKRVSDVLFSALALLITSPIILFSILAVKLESKGPAIYRQKRLGLRKKEFTMFKIRSMRHDAEHDGIPRLANDSDPRITRIGAFMRKYRIDELPQFWNVIKGDMSIVGPRPERDFYAEKIVAQLPAYSMVHQVRPGITSWGMVKYGYANSVDKMVRRAQFDLVYLDNINFIIDLKIILHTIVTVINGRGQ